MILVLENFAPAVSQRVIWVHSRQTPLGVARCVVIERGSLLTRPFFRNDRLSMPRGH